jgi:hypothetical protein
MIDKKEDDEKNTDLIDLIDNQTPNTNMQNNFSDRDR